MVEARRADGPVHLARPPARGPLAAVLREPRGAGEEGRGGAGAAGLVGKGDRRGLGLQVVAHLELVEQGRAQNPDGPVLLRVVGVGGKGREADVPLPAGGHRHAHGEDPEEVLRDVVHLVLARDEHVGVAVQLQRLRVAPGAGQVEVDGGELAEACGVVHPVLALQQQHLEELELGVLRAPCLLLAPRPAVAELREERPQMVRVGHDDGRPGVGDGTARGVLARLLRVAEGHRLGLLAHGDAAEVEAPVEGADGAEGAWLCRRPEAQDAISIVVEAHGESPNPCRLKETLGTDPLEHVRLVPAVRRRRGRHQLPVLLLRPGEAEAKNALKRPADGESLVHHEEHGVVHGGADLPHAHEVGGHDGLDLPAAEGEHDCGRLAVERRWHPEGRRAIRPPVALVLGPAPAGVGAEAGGHDDVVAAGVGDDVKLLAWRADLDLDREVRAAVAQGGAGHVLSPVSAQGPVRGSRANPLTLLHQRQRHRAPRVLLVQQQRQRLMRDLMSEFCLGKGETERHEEESPKEGHGSKPDEMKKYPRAGSHREGR
mmetsp:Transcript_116487/g.340820  ORF Transcript_116487/g.340820 Transcript_116487/m.340820 type:complete len:543 (+) Transcript_116487:121-1749(+)